jgi:hypothetical protein
VTRNRSILRLGRTFPNRNRIDDLTARVAVHTGMPRAADPPFGS